MNKLPIETFLQITKCIDDSTKFKCLYVCKQWHEIFSSIIYKKVKIGTEIEKTIEFFEEKRLGANVQSLEIEREKLKMEHLKSLVRLFPNVQCLELYIDEVDEVDSLDYTDTIVIPYVDPTFEKWKKLKTVTENPYYTIFTAVVIANTTSTWLTTIEIDFKRTSEDNMRNMMYFFLDTLSLHTKELILSNALLDYDDIIRIQNSPSSIDVLRLRALKFGSTEYLDVYEQNIGNERRNEVKELDIDICAESVAFGLNNEDPMAVFLNLIASYFKSVESLEITCLGRYSKDDIPGIVNIAQNCTKLKKFNTNLCPFTKEILQAFDENNSFLKLDQFSLYSQDISELIALSLSKQRHHIKDLSLVIPTETDGLVEALSRFSCLEALDINHYLGRDYIPGKILKITLNQFLIQHQTLRKLRLAGCLVDIEDKHVDSLPSPLLLIQDLNLEKVTLTEKCVFDPKWNVFDFIDESCLKLTKFHVLAELATKQDNNNVIAAQRTIRVNFQQQQRLCDFRIYIEGYSYIFRPNPATWLKCSIEDGYVEYKETKEDSPKEDAKIISVSHQFTGVLGRRIRVDYF